MSVNEKLSENAISEDRHPEPPSSMNASIHSSPSIEETVNTSPPFNKKRKYQHYQQSRQSPRSPAEQQALRPNCVKEAMPRRNAPDFKPDVRFVSKKNRKPQSMPNRKENVTVLPEPIKSVVDKKLYKVIRLENGLTALLISDPSRPPLLEEQSSDESSGSDEGSDHDSDGTESASSTASVDQHGGKKRSEFDEEKLAACALAVGVGSFSDPPDIQGLAHFVEHMVFMGSEKYPKENEFDAFVKKKGGSDNASTDCEQTTFYFEIQEKHLGQAMDMFSQFFVSPLMLKEAMQREREAIESEFSSAAPSDTNRKDQLLCSMFPEGHPARTFTWGNLRSLKDDVGDDEKLYEAAHEFRKRHYSAHRMTVAVQARMELSAIEQHVINAFGSIPSNKLPRKDFSQFNFREELVTPEFHSMYYVKPMSDINEVNLTWCVRSLLSEYESKPHQYLSYVLGHEGKGSLLSYLKKKVWALGIYTGNSEGGTDYTSMYSLFSIQVSLTKEGLDHIDEVLEAVFSYINMLKKLGPSERIYQEIKTIAETSFRYDEESPPVQYVEMLADNMHFFPPEHYITGDKLYYKYDPQGIQELLKTMRPELVNIMILSNKYSTPVHYDAQEPWFSTEYKREKIPEKWLHRWGEIQPYKQFHLPEENIYITTNFDLIPPDQAYLDEADRLGIDLTADSAKDIHKKVASSSTGAQILKKDDLIATINNFRLDQPNLIRKNRHMELWYKPDFKFRFPTALLYFYFITPLSLKSPKDACLLDVWNDVLQHSLKEEVYPANMADLTHALYVSDLGITLKVSGYSQNLHLLVELISRKMRVSAKEVPPGLFEAVREVRQQTYHNLLIKPHKLATDLRLQIMLDPYISLREKAAEINNITLSDLKRFSEDMLERLYVQVLVQGNLAWHEAIRISEKVLSNIKWNTLAEGEIPELKVKELPRGERTVRVRSFNPLSANSIVTNYYQAEARTPRDVATLEVLMMIMEEPVFDVLRTKEQLGYSVFSRMRYTFGVLGFSITVNSQEDKFSVAHVEERMSQFVREFGKDARALPRRTLAAARAALVQLKHTVDFELKEEVERHWREIVSREYEFQRLYKEAKYIENVTAADMKNWVENHFPGYNESQYKKLSVQVMGHPQNKEDNEIAKVASTNYSLTLMDASNPVGDFDEKAVQFISDVKEFKRELPIIAVPKVELGQC